ncbi:MAG TPA: TIGR04086 family membrane protein [Ruminococcaceae bacterium]|nr:TIGR04086 family membrane protein [Oscillospiraceae bacterium]
MSDLFKPCPVTDGVLFCPAVPVHTLQQDIAVWKGAIRMKGESRAKDLHLSVMIKGTIIGALIGVTVTLLLVLVCVYAVVKMQTIPYGAIAPMVIVTATVGAFMGGYCSGRISRQKGLLSGAVSGLLVFLCMLAAGTLSGGMLGTMTLLRLLLPVTAGALGGIAAVNKRQRRK